MDMQIRQTMALKQQLVMTPKLQQALKLLQVPALQLEQILKAEMLANPMLEEVPTEATDESQDDEIDRKHEEDLERWEDYFDAHNQGSMDGGGTRGSYEKKEEFERIQPDVKTFHESLLEQLRLQSRPEDELQIGEYIIYNLDDNGFLTCSVEEIAEKLGEGLERVEHVLRQAIQILDPPGVGAVDLPQCLVIQLRHLGLGDSLAVKIVIEHMPELERRKYPQIAKALKVPLNDVKSAVAIISGLEPRPGQAISSVGARSVIPDLVVERVDGEYIVSLNDRNVPRLQVSPSYRRLIGKGSNSSKETKKYVVEKLNSANWLIKTIEQRRQTMMKVMNHIVKAQRDFFDRGIAHMKPLTLLEVADVIGMHESTVSRVTNGKYVQTPRGVYELKFFFGSSLSSTGGADISSKSVKDKIAGLIRNENSSKPYSDQQIVEILKGGGLKIARRTVAKYRDQLKILPARMRKND